MDASALEYERVMEKKKQLLIKIQETKTGIRNKQNQLKILEEGLQKIKDQEGKESVGGKLNIFLRDFSVILEAMRTEKAFMETKYATQSAQIYYRVEKMVCFGSSVRCQTGPVRHWRYLFIMRDREVPI